MINQIEQALINRLEAGLGTMVYSVGSYSGEINEEQISTQRLPACLVSYAGSDFEVKAMGAKAKRYITTETFVVLLLVRSMRSTVAGRVGGVTDKEVGVNQLADAVKYLLINQTLDGLVTPIAPKRIRTILNNAEVKKQKYSALALEFEMSYCDTDYLEDGLYPEGESQKEQAFKQYKGKLDKPYPDLQGFNNRIVDPTNNASTDIVVVRREDES